ncbi:MliC family protein [Paraburkholderia sp. SARCC-3016]|uniref:MliC family protein n=1 Tax=Paraburkholderia sp. SARCC-3016 TaxID=3058611 RepID=UPI0028091CB4|nr:MliC family protein [Paraburkholderia sp. SARCC-3016]MDQ7979334.1 MliC family protein [Paraburkholderia sp. SARCC-3016]
MNQRFIPAAAALAAVSIVLSAALPTVAVAATGSTPRFGDLRTEKPRMQKYTCATGRILHVTYLSASNGQSFAVVPVNGRDMLFVSTISGSGVRYQAGSYTWWTKGPRADLYDSMQGGPDAPPILSDCVTIVR